MATINNTAIIKIYMCELRRPVSPAPTSERDAISDVRNESPNTVHERGQCAAGQRSKCLAVISGTILNGPARSNRKIRKESLDAHHSRPMSN